MQIRSSRRNPSRFCAGIRPAPSAPPGPTSSSTARSGSWGNLREKEVRWMKPSEPKSHQNRAQSLTIAVQKGGVDVCRKSRPLVRAVRMEVTDAVLLDAEGPVKRRLEEVDLLRAAVLPPQRRLDVGDRKAEPLQGVWARNPPPSVKHPVAVACSRNTNPSGLDPTGPAVN